MVSKYGVYLFSDNVDDMSDLVSRSEKRRGFVLSETFYYDSSTCAAAAISGRFPVKNHQEQKTDHSILDSKDSFPKTLLMCHYLFFKVYRNFRFALCANIFL